MNTTKPNDLEQRIVEAARQLFVERGFAETSMSDIAARVGINRPTLHYYFRTKDRLFQAIFSPLVRSLRPKVDEIFRQDIPFLEAMSLVLDEYFDLFLHNPDLPRFISGEIQRDIQHLLDVAREEHIDETLHVIGRRLTDEMETGRLRRVPLPVVFSTFYGLLSFPMIAKKLLVELFLLSDDDYPAMLQEWKRYILFHLTNLLNPDLPLTTA